MDINYKTTNGATPLHVAERNSQQVTIFLLSKNSELEPQDKQLRTPVHYAIFDNSKIAFKLLLDRGAKVDNSTVKMRGKEKSVE